MTWTDIGPIVDENGNPILGSDPEIRLDGSFAHLLYTSGPYASLGASWIVHRSSAPLSGAPYLDPGIVIRAAPGYSAVETPTVVKVAPNKWIGLVQQFGPAKLGNHLRVFETDSLFASSYAQTATIIEPTLSWELGTNYSEPGICYMNGILVACYAALGALAGPSWRIGLMGSQDLGVTWQKHPVPIIVPPATFSSPSGFNAASHGCLVPDPYVAGKLHIFGVWSGRVPFNQKGIAQWTYDGTGWQGPLLVIPQGSNYSNIGGPSVEIDVIRGKWVMAYHATPLEDKPRYLRMAEMPL